MRPLKVALGGAASAICVLTFLIPIILDRLALIKHGVEMDIQAVRSLEDKAWWEPHENPSILINFAGDSWWNTVNLADLSATNVKPQAIAHVIQIIAVLGEPLDCQDVRASLWHY